MIEISNSSLNTFRLCQKKWYWHYIERLEPHRKVVALSLGEIIHEAFDRFYLGAQKNDVTLFIDKTYKKLVADAPIEEQEDVYLSGKTALGMFLNFPFDKMKFEEITSELEFKVPIVKDVLFVGRVDGKVKREGKWWVREIKTTGEARSVFEKRSAISGQATGYAYALSYISGAVIQGIVYDYIRKPKLYKRATESMAEFGQRIYQDYCDKSKQDSYFGRYPTYRSAFDIARWKEDAVITATHIEDCVGSKCFARNTEACYSYNTECPYKRICFMDVLDPFIVDLFYERKEAKK